VSIGTDSRRSSEHDIEASRSIGSGLFTALAAAQQKGARIGYLAADLRANAA
jgi:hypothetical protein